MTKQATLERATGTTVDHAVTTETHRIACPVCKSDVSRSKGGQRIGELPTHGWECSTCDIVLPCRSDSEATTFTNGWTGIEVRFRDGEERYVPVPEYYAEDDDQ